MRLVFLALVLSLAAAACAQAPDTAANGHSAPESNAIQQLVAREFGPSFSLVQGFPVLKGDLEGAGKEEDVVIVATSKDPMIDQGQFHYKVADPYDSFFGFGDPSVTSKFAADTTVPRMLLVVHDWKAPKAKFVLINVPFQKLSITRASIKKKTLIVIKAEEPSEQSYVYWAGKKYKWEPGPTASD